ncbi:syntaxin-11-like [Oncorhynchus clarkii lewisi]|uniref:syntaxin-11-like n=1 Tax=Oncorhynchus clarkii lewisi TaxID=490388 RepID=UPI0039B9666E
MWHGLKSITDYKGKSRREQPSDTSLPDKLNAFSARFEEGKPEAWTRAQAVLDDRGITLSAGRMRDRLCHMQTICKEQDDFEPETELYGPEYDLNKISQEAVVFQASFSSSPTMDSILEEAHSMRQEISLLHLEVERLVEHNERIGTTVHSLTIIKHDSNSIARGIHQHGKALYVRLQTLGAQSCELEEKHLYRPNPIQPGRGGRSRLQRQAFIIENGGEGWGELSQSLQTEGHSSRWAPCEIKGRHKELVELEARLREVHDLFQQMAMLVEKQGTMLNNIEANVYGTDEYIGRVNNLSMVAEGSISNLKKQIHIAHLFGILVVVALNIFKTNTQAEIDLECKIANESEASDAMLYHHGSM